MIVYIRHLQLPGTYDKRRQKFFMVGESVEKMERSQSASDRTGDCHVYSENQRNRLPVSMADRYQLCRLRNDKGCILCSLLPVCQSILLSPFILGAAFWRILFHLSRKDSCKITKRHKVDNRRLFRGSLSDASVFFRSPGSRLRYGKGTDYAVMEFFYIS